LRELNSHGGELLDRINPISDFFFDPGISGILLTNETAKIAVAGGNLEVEICKCSRRGFEIVSRDNKDTLRWLWEVAVVGSDFL
jgi:hypothetical protein